jgi:hypothetical protein
MKTIIEFELSRRGNKTINIDFIKAFKLPTNPLHHRSDD